MKQIPKNQDGTNYGYLSCKNGTQAAVYAKLKTTGTYWVWRSESGSVTDTASSLPPSCLN